MGVVSNIPRNLATGNILRKFIIGTEIKITNPTAPKNHDVLNILDRDTNASIEYILVLPPRILQLKSSKLDGNVTGQRTMHIIISR